MKSYRKIFGFGLWLIVIIAAMNVCAAEPSGLVPEGLVVRDGFEPGTGNPVGRVQMVRGEVLIIHADMAEGFRAAEGLSLYMGDMIITTDDGRIRFQMLDGSLLTLASNTKLVINRNVFDPSMQTRTSFFNMISGKARFWVKKLIGFKRSDFEVKTQTAIVGVRGSDFAVIADVKRTEVVAFDKTDIYIIKLVDPDAEPVHVVEFERAVVEGDAVEKSKASRDLIESMKQEFGIPDDLTERLEKPDLHGGVRIPTGKLVQPALIGSHGGKITDVYGHSVRNPEKASESREQLDRVLEETDKTDTGDQEDEQGQEEEQPTGTTGTGGTGGTL